MINSNDYQLSKHIDVKAIKHRLQKSLLLLQHVGENVWDYEYIIGLVANK